MSPFHPIKGIIFSLVGPGAAVLPAASSHLLCWTEAQHALLFHWRLIPSPPPSGRQSGEERVRDSIQNLVPAARSPCLISPPSRQLISTVQPPPPHSSYLRPPQTNQLTPLSPKRWNRAHREVVKESSWSSSCHTSRPVCNARRAEPTPASHL